MAVVFPPLVDERTAWSLVAEAGGLVVQSTRFPNIVIAYAPDADFRQRVSDSGALLLLAAAGLCRSPIEDAP